jgi:uncharacterized protein
MRALIAAALLTLASAVSAQTPDVIVVTGSATVQHAPDIAFVTVSVETRARTPRDAQRQNADAVSAVLKKLADAGVPRDALKTVGVSIQQQYDNNGRRVPTDVLARNTVEIATPDVARAGELADTAVQGGATALEGIRFDLKNRAGAEHEAIAQAVRDGAARAEVIAAAARRSLDRVIRIEDGRGAGNEPRPMMAMRVAAAPASATVAEPGLIEIHADVTLTYAMK